MKFLELKTNEKSKINLFTEMNVIKSYINLYNEIHGESYKVQELKVLSEYVLIQSNLAVKYDYFNVLEFIKY